jgi:UDP-N-acetylglucosamine:LPS N-acetylglucosamine transferase
MAKASGKVMAVASAGGHWEQMQILAKAFDGQEVLFVTTKQALLDQAGLAGVVVKDCNRDSIADTLRCVVQCLRLVLSVRPKAVVSTGAAPGLLCLACGRLVGARAIWVDSFANVEKLSMSGKLARFVAHDWLTQWAHLAGPKGPRYSGELL